MTRFLVADDSELNRELALAALEGHDVAIERDGPAALSRALRERFDVIVLDIEMPGMDGGAVCRALRNAGVRSPILALTASALPDQIASLMGDGFNECLTKPIPPAKLREVLERYGGAS